MEDGLYSCCTFRRDRKGIPEVIKTTDPGIYGSQGIFSWEFWRQRESSGTQDSRTSNHTSPATCSSPSEGRTPFLPRSQLCWFPKLVWGPSPTCVERRHKEAYLLVSSTIFSTRAGVKRVISHTRMHAHAHACTHEHKHTHTHERMHTHTRTHEHTHTHRTRTHACTHTHTHTHTHTSPMYTQTY